MSIARDGGDSGNAKVERLVLKPGSFKERDQERPEAAVDVKAQVVSQCELAKSSDVCVHINL